MTLHKEIVEREELSLVILTGSPFVHSPSMTFCKKGSSIDLSLAYFDGIMSVSGDRVYTGVGKNFRSGDWVWNIFANVDGLNRLVENVALTVHRNGTVLEKQKPSMSYTDNPLAKCQYCGHWGALYCACVHCGGPIDP